jgi:hypothetical protein
MIKNQTIILNTLADNSADFSVDANGRLQVTGLDAENFGNPRADKLYVQVQPSTDEVLGVITTTFTAPSSIAGTRYQLTLNSNKLEGGSAVPNTDSYSLTASSSDTVTTIAVAFRNWINANAGLNCTASNSAGVLTITAKAGFPVITATTRNPAFVAIVATTAGVPSRGQGTSLITNPNFINKLTYGSFTLGAKYTRVSVRWSVFNDSAMPSSRTEAINQIDVFVNEAATSSGSDNAVVNRALILNTTYGSAYLLQAGYRAVAPTTAATTTASVTVTTGAIALASGSVTLASLGAQSGDFLIINTGTTFSAIDSTKITGITGAAAGFGTNVTTVTAAAFKYIAVRNFPVGF